MQAPLPAVGPTADSVLHRPGPVRRAAVGASSAVPSLGGFAAFATLELAAAARSLSPALVAAGLWRGTRRWVPFALGTSIFYAAEFELRAATVGLPFGAPRVPVGGALAGRAPPAEARTPAAATTTDGAGGTERDGDTDMVFTEDPYARGGSDDGAAGAPRPTPLTPPPPPPTQYERMFGAAPQGDDGPPESTASRVTAGALASFTVASSLFLLRRPHFSSVGSVLGTTVGCAAAAAFMPSWDAVEKRFPL